MSDNMNGKQILEWVMRFAGAVLLVLMAVIAYQGKMVLNEINQQDHRLSMVENRIAVIDSKLYSQAEAAADQAELRKALIDAKMNVPSWFNSDIQELKSEVSKLREEFQNFRNHYQGESP